MRKPNMVEVEKNLVERLQSQGRERVMAQFKQLQTAVYVMCGGGFLGSSAARQPHGFYIDSRVGRLPYSKTKIMQAVVVLQLYIKVLRLNPNELPDFFMDAHNCGVF